MPPKIVISLSLVRLGRHTRRFVKFLLIESFDLYSANFDNIDNS